MIHLPPELLHDIFRCFTLPNDAATLCSCRLVRSEWAVIAREHLYSIISVRGAPDAGRNLQSLDSFLGTHPSVGYAVTTLDLSGEPWTTAIIPAAPLMSSLARFPRLRHLRLNGWRFPTIPVHPQARRHLRTLVLRDAGNYLDSAGKLLQFLDLFSSIDHLRMEKVWFRYAYGMSYQAIVRTLPIPEHLAVSSISLHSADHHTELLLEAFRLTRILETLQELCLSFYDFAPLIPSLARFLADPRCRVQKLSFDFHAFPFSTDKRSLFEIRCALDQYLRPVLPSLCSLQSFTLRTGLVGADVSAFWDGCLSLLRLLPTSLLELRLVVEDGHFGYDPVALGRVLERFETLAYVGIHGVVQDEREKELRAEMSELDGRDVLQFHANIPCW